MMDKATITNLDQLFVSDYKNNLEVIGKNDNSHIKNLRLRAIDAFGKQGVPDRNNELYKFSDIKKLMTDMGRLVHPFIPPADVNTPVKEIFQCEVTHLDTHDLALINGWYPRTIPIFQKLNGQAVVGSLTEAVDLYPEIINDYFGKYADYQNDALTALNTAYASDGVFAYFPDNSVIDKAVQFVSLVTQDEDALVRPLVQPRNLIVVGDNVDVKLVLCDHTLSNEKSFTNSVTEIKVGKHSNVEIYRLQNQNNNGAMVSMLHIHLEDYSRVLSNTITLNGGFVRNNQHVVIDGENAEANIYGIYLTDRTQHVDNNTFIEHRKPNSVSNQLFKGILDDQANAVFRGRIYVARDAQKTNSYQKNNNLLLTDEAKMNSMPQLEIYADDVKCSHGATVGYLNNEELFYMRSRGVCEKEARLLLMNAFVGEVVGKINITPLRDRITYLVSKRLRGELSHCASCVLNCRE